MIKKLLPICLFIATLFLFSCEKSNRNYQVNESQTAIETTSIITFVVVAVILLIAYTSKRRH
ncbi:hypothetical protein CEY12_06540 [Chryseobacterium sp. T16E-39]|nr:hypothetical protein CEY12_06540 [Chryseobacterium sp. T16E-39]